MSSNVRAVISVAAFVALVSAALILCNKGVYGWTLFLLLPMIAGGLGAWTCQPTTLGDAIKIGAAVGALGCGAFLVLGAEGLICAAMALPLAVLLGMAGSLIVYAAGPAPNLKRPIAMTLLLPLTMFFDSRTEPPVFKVSTSIIVHASPNRVWKSIVAFPEIKAKPDWLL